MYKYTFIKIGLALKNILSSIVIVGIAVSCFLYGISSLYDDYRVYFYLHYNVLCQTLLESINCFVVGCRFEK